MNINVPTPHVLIFFYDEASGTCERVLGSVPVVRATKSAWRWFRYTELGDGVGVAQIPDDAPHLVFLNDLLRPQQRLLTSTDPYCVHILAGCMLDPLRNQV